MVVVSGDREYAASRFEFRQHATEMADVPAHRVTRGKIIAGQEDQIRMFAIDCTDCLLKAIQILFAVDVKVADLARDHTGKPSRQAPTIS